MDGRTDSRSDYSADPRFDYFLNYGQTIGFLVGRGAVFPNSLKVDYLSNKVEAFIFPIIKKYVYNCYYAIYACFTSVSLCKLISDQHFLQSFNKNQLKIERELYTGTKAAL